jgi:glycosyltransferase involved in cell wall biosynthesis
VKVSVHMPAYNHGPYIAQAVESVLAQDVDFDYEIVIADDASTDHTPAVARDYARRFPDKVRLILNERNLGIYEKDQVVLRACRGQYIAWLESDDYWTAADKLRKQVDLLDRNADHSACFHRAGRIGAKQPVCWQPGPPQSRAAYAIDDLLEMGHFIPSCTVLFRSELARTPAPWTRETPFLEATYCARFALAGKIGFIDEEMAVYRFHDRGIYGQATEVQQLENATRAHELIGEHLNLGDRPSYHRGLARLKEARARAQGVPGT